MPKVTLTKPAEGSMDWGPAVNQDFTDIESAFKQDLYQREVYEMFAEFENGVRGTPFIGMVAAAGSGGVARDGEDNHPGIVENFNNGAGGYGYISTQVGAFRLGAGQAVFEAVARVPTLPDANQSFAFRIGFLDVLNADPVDGVYFELTEADSDWQCKTSSNSTRTTSDTGQAAQANTWTRLRIEVNAAGSEANFYIDGTLKATITTNLPTGAGRELGVVASIIKSAGTTNRTAQIDYTYFKIDFSSAR